MKNLQKTDSRRPPNYLPSVNSLDRFLGFLFGDDIFISYSHRDAINYAPALATALANKKFVSYLDQYGGEVENELPARVIRHLKRSTALVLIGTPAAVQSEAVRREVEIFKLTGRPIIPIDVGNALTRSEWIEIVRGIPVSNETVSSRAPANKQIALTVDSDQIISEQVSPDVEAVAAPSSMVVSRVVDSFKYTKRNDRQRRMFLLAFILLIASLGAVVISSFKTWNATIEAARAIHDRTEAQRQEKQANDDAEVARSERLRAEVARGKALKDKADADKAASAAAAREQIALKNEARASANARREETRASSLQKVATSAQLIGTEPGKALAVAVSAYHQYRTREAQTRLLDNLQRYPGLKKIQRNHQTGVSAVEAPVNGMLVSIGDGKFLPWATAITPKRNNLIFWDAQTFEPIDIETTDELFDQSKISCISGGNLCATNNARGWIVLWTVDLTSRKFTPHETKIPSPSSSNGFELVNEKLLASTRKNGQVYLVNLERPDSAPTPLATGFQSTANQIIVSTKKDQLAVAFAEGIALISLSQSTAPKTLRYSEEQQKRFWNASSLSFSSDDELLAIGTTDRASLILKVSDLQPLGEPIEDGGGLVAFARGKTGNKLVTVNAEGISLWELHLPGAGRTRRLHIPVTGVRSLSFLPGSSQELVTGFADGTVALWDLMRENTLARRFTEVEYDWVVDRFAFDKTGKYLIGNNDEYLKNNDHGFEDMPTRLWRFADDKYTLVSERDSAVENLRFPRRVVDVNDQSIWFEKRDGITREEFVLTPGGKDIFRTQNAVLTSDDRTLVTLDGDDVVVWDVTNHRQARFLKKLSERKTPTCLAISHTEKVLAVGYNGGEIALFDLPHRRPIGTLNSPFVAKNINGAVSAIAFSFNDSMIASSGPSSRIDLWDRRSRDLIGSLDFRPTDIANALVFTPSGNRLLSHGFYGWRIWDISPTSWVNRAVNITRHLKN